MKIAVVGLGSMGKRRIRLAKQCFESDPRLAGSSVVGVDTAAERCASASQELGIETACSLTDVLASCDAVIVSTSPLSHAPIITASLRAGKHVFSEINLVSDGYEENINLAREQGKVLFLSSTFLYREETRYIAEAVSRLRPATYRYHVGQYLPDWHPWEDYRNFFVANPRTDACRELFAIELPWLQRAFGPICKCTTVRRKVSELDVPYDDTYILTLEHEDGTVGSLQVDIVCRRAVRDFELSGEDGYLTWDGSANGVKELSLETGEMMPVDLYGDIPAVHRDGYARFIVENAYRHELEAFFAQILDGSKPPYGFEDDLKTLALIDDIEGAKQ